jgi:Tol biopolymer transport system component
VPSADRSSPLSSASGRWLRSAAGAFRRNPARAALLILWPIAGLLLLAVSAWALGYAARWQPVTQMTAQVFHDGSDPAAEQLVTSLDPEKLAIAAGLDPRAPFEVEWRGLLVATEDGTHRLRVRADDGAAMWVGETLILDKHDHLGELHETAPVALAQGLHPFRLRYVQRGGDGLIRLSWAVPSSREEFHAVPIVAETDPPPVFRRIEKALRYPRHVAVAWGVWLIVGLTLGGVVLAEHVAGVRLASILSPATAIALIVLSTVLLGANLEVGLQPFHGWAPDEVLPRDVYFAGAHWFTGGWYHQYPPLPFYLLAMVNAPFVVLEQWGRLSFNDPEVYAAAHLVARGVMLAFTILTCLAMALLAARTINLRAAPLAAFGLIGVPIVAFYSKTSNVDAAYLFWVVIAAIAMARAVTSGSIADHAWLGVAAAAAVTSKDQAYGFFPGAALVLLILAWRRSPGSWSARLRRTLMSPRLWAGLLAFVAIYTILVGVLWNAEGVRQHFHVITGQASAPFRMFPATLAGLLTLAGTTTVLIGLSVGLVIAAGAIVGVGLCTSQRQLRPVLLLMAMPLSYLATFIGVVGYVYDRFLLAVVPFIVLLASCGLEWSLSRIPRSEWRQAATALVLLALLYPSAALNLRLASDSRFEVEAWMREHFTNDPSILAVGSQLYLPNLYPYQHRIIQRAKVADILTWDAEVLVLNEDWLDRPGQPSDETLARELGEARYRRVLSTTRTGTASPFGRVFTSGLHIDPLFSNISKTSPPISIWVRDDETAESAARATPLEPLLAHAEAPLEIVATLNPSRPPGLSGHVVFHSSREGRNKLFTVDVATGTVARLTSGTDHHDEDPSWSPDGSRVAFASNRFDPATFDIAVVDRRDASVRRVTSEPAFEQHPTWSIDGARILFSSERDGTQAVFEMPADGSAIARLSAPPERALMPAETPGGRQVAFTAGTPEGLQVVMYDRSSNTERMVTTGPAAAARPRWSRDGTRLSYFRLGNEGRYVEVLDVGAARATAIRIDGLASLSDPDWSPDGRFLVAAGARQAGDAADWDLVVIDLDNPGRAYQLTTGAGSDRAPSWTAR